KRLAPQHGRAARQPGRGRPAAKRGAEEGRLLSWLGARGAELPAITAQAASARAARCPPRLLRHREKSRRRCKCRRDGRRGNRLAAEEGAGRSDGWSSSQLTERTRAAQAEALPRFGQAGICRAAWRLPISSCLLLSFLTRRLEQADPLD
uniref:Zinc finger protein n=1 Tax=Macrostomum lignano TaxID=282301 RepID=A0A1I8F840_9PLAT